MSYDPSKSPGQGLQGQRGWPGSSSQRSADSSGDGHAGCQGSPGAWGQEQGGEHERGKDGHRGREERSEDGAEGRGGNEGGEGDGPWHHPQAFSRAHRHSVPVPTLLRSVLPEDKAWQNRVSTQQPGDGGRKGEGERREAPGDSAMFYRGTASVPPLWCLSKQLAEPRQQFCLKIISQGISIPFHT